METTMARFFPTADRVLEARQHLAGGHFGELDALMGVSDLATPCEADLPAIVDEFCSLTSELDLSAERPSSFMVLVPVTINGATHTTPVLVDMEAYSLSFTSHPEIGAGEVTDEVLVSNPRLISDVRKELVGVIATWHNTLEAEV
jgi:hypothetical protein